LEDWYAEILTPAQMSRAGWTQESVRPGDQVTLVGHPGKKGAHIMWLEYLVMPDGRKLDRDTDAH
jgi:hydrogenase maturation factor